MGDHRHRIVVVGIGDDGPAGLGWRARRIIEQAELLVGGRRHLAWFEDHPAEKLAITNNLDEVVARLVAEVGQRRCVVLASGDPCFFGIGPLLVQRLGRESVEIIPHVSSVSLAFARLGLAWQDATILSAHGRALSGVIGPLARASKVGVLTDDQNTPSAIASALLQRGLSDRPAYVLEHLGGPSERIIETRLADLPDQEFAPLNVLVLTPSSPPRSSHFQEFGRSEAEFRHARGQVTKAEVRAVCLSKLQLPGDGVLWDVGAGSGSLAIEAAGLMPTGAVHAIERDPEQLECLRENVARHCAYAVSVTVGEAPAALAELPRPDRVFVGGGGADLSRILKTCLHRLDGRGRLVVTAATMESTVAAESCFRAAGWNQELVQLAVARGRPAGGRTRLEAMNPVFILSAWPRLADGGTGRWGDKET